MDTMWSIPSTFGYVLVGSEPEDLQNSDPSGPDWTSNILLTGPNIPGSEVSPKSGQNSFLRSFFLKILPLCTVSIQERFIIKDEL